MKDMYDKSISTVMLDSDKCRGCVTCMKRCPTEAIRVRNGKATVLYERCIACGECVRLCPHHAKLARYDSFDIVNDFKYKIALPAPSLYGQFNNLDDINIVLNGLKEIGFDEIFEVARGAELLSQATRKFIATNKDLPKPIISSACPAVVELILVRFHSLEDRLLNMLAPVDIVAQMAREEAINKGISPQDIGVFFISPCPAKVFALKTGLGVDKPVVDGVLSVSEVYMRLLPIMPKLKEIKPLSKVGKTGLQWASSGGEAAGLYIDKYLAADGIENVINMLTSIEDGKLNYIDFVELNACNGGCVGGVLNIENPYVAKARIRNLRNKLQFNCNTLEQYDKPNSYYEWQTKPQVKEVYRLDEDRAVAMKKMSRIEDIYKTLPNLDCGLCGAPSCRAFAEDVESGMADISMCVRMDNYYKTK
ncbi:MAG: [Fe-Fe] hydrogenase large subunit C-terminal domain-containing protein [Clostridia bacterium]|nr:[Fe-Fe] hydrogenase large subunit C-terminal domain-containing protein [Clostridia bacterium]